MERTKIKSFKKADAILTADWHLREDVPACRVDAFWETQWKKVDFISALQKKHACPVFHSGDLFDYWKPSPMLLSKTMYHLPDWFMTVYGNHDLPQHNIELKHKSGVFTLETANKLSVFDTCHWLEIPTKASYLWQVEGLDTKTVLVWHVMTYQGLVPWPGCEAPKSSKLLMKYPQFDMIITGDNHIPFVEEYKGRLLVNPGSIFRMTTKQSDHKPRVYLWYADTNTVEPVYLPIANDAISNAHIEQAKDRDNRIDAFISTLDNDWEASLSFEQNLEIFITKNEVEEEVLQIVREAMEK